MTLIMLQFLLNKRLWKYITRKWFTGGFSVSNIINCKYGIGNWHFWWVFAIEMIGRKLERSKWSLSKFGLIYVTYGVFCNLKISKNSPRIKLFAIGECASVMHRQHITILCFGCASFGQRNHLNFKFILTANQTDGGQKGNC